MEHTLIKDIKDSDTVLCVVKGVVSTSDQHLAKIKRTCKTDGNIGMSEKVNLFFIATNTLP